MVSSGPGTAPSGLAPAPAPEPARPRLNPFAFPSDVDFRLLLLVAAVISSSMFIYNWIYFDLPQARSDLAVYRQCQQAAQAAFPSDPAAANHSFEVCRSPIERRKGGLIVAGSAAILLLAFALYLAAPLVKLRRHRLIALTTDDAPDLVPALDALTTRADLSERPRFVWNPLNGAAVGLAFGRRGGYYIAVTGGLASRFYTDRPAFDAVLLHELGHLRNGDVDKTYLALSLWQAFVAIALLPLLLTIVLQPTLAASLDVAWVLGWRIVALAALVYLARNAVLRSRETYADLRASQWEGAGGGLSRVLGGLTPEPSGRVSSWLGAMRVHPARSARERALTDTRSLFRIGFWDAFATGLAAGIAYPSLVTLILLFFTGYRVNLWYLTTGEVAGLIASTVLGLLAGGVIGVGVWRATFAPMAGDAIRISLAALAGGLALGLALGDWVAFEGGFQKLPSDPVGLSMFAVAYLCALAILAAGLFVLFRWFRDTSAEWLWLALDRDSPPHWLPVFLVSSLLLCLWLAVALQLRNVVGLLGWFDSPPYLYLVLAFGLALQALMSPLAVVAVASIWFFPLLAGLRRRARGTVGAWAFLDPSPQVSLAEAPAPRLDRLLVLAAGGGVVYALFIVAARLAMGPMSRRSDTEILLFFVTEVALAAVIAGSVAAVAAARAADLAVMQGLAAAFLSGTLMSAEALVVNVAFGGHAEPGFIWQTFSTTVLSGAAVAFPLAWVAEQLTKQPGGH